MKELDIRTKSYLYGLFLELRKRKASSALLLFYMTDLKNYRKSGIIYIENEGRKEN